MNKPLLSICIPTYNRGNYLVNSIESIINQEEFKTKEVEIIISDNASTDNTEQIGRRYGSQYENIHYFRNAENIRDRNFPLVLSKGNGLLRRLCNDTLCFKEGSLKYICYIIKKYEKTKPVICWLPDNNNTEIEEENFRNGVKGASYWLTWIASFSIWDSECMGIEKDTYGAELLLWQVRKILELASRKNAMVLVHKTLASSQPVKNKDISYGLYQVFYENYFKLLNPYFETGELTAEDREGLEKDLLLNFFPVWCARWKLQAAGLQYSASEDLCGQVYQQFHNKPYWNAYRKRFKKIYWKIRIRKFLKRVSKRG